MANGDDAAAAGMDVVAATDDKRLGYDEINKTRDYLASVRTDTGWLYLPLGGTWVDYGASYAPAQYRRRGGVVHIQGLIKSGNAASGQLLATLPVGFRPAQQITRTVSISGGVGSVEIKPDGQITALGAVHATFTSLGMAAFLAEV